MKTIIVASLVLAVTSATSFAGTPLINARQNAQSHRIFKGVQNNQLTYNETVKLVQGQARVAEPGEPGQGRRRRHAV